MRLLLFILKLSTQKELSDWSIYLTVLHMIGVKNKRWLTDMTLIGLIDVGVSPKKKCKKKKYNTHQILIRLM